MLNRLRAELVSLKNPTQAQNLQRYFKTGPGEYGEGDIFLGIKVPVQRELVKKYKTLSLLELQPLLDSKIHEERLIALLILLEQYKKSEKKEELVNFYLHNRRNINNWDLVDLSAPRILGDYFLNRDKNVLYQLISSKNLWDRRIAVLSTFMFIKEKRFADSLKMAEILLQDYEDLIHKAVGWMLREVGKKDGVVLEDFLNKHYQKMPRTMLRYAIEKLPEERRKFYLGKV